MAHESQRQFFQSAKLLFPDMFRGCRVLDVGSLDVNGNNRGLFDNCEYIGLDIGEGPNVDVVCLAHEYDARPFRTICSSSCFEHDMYLPSTLANILRLLEPEGLLLFNCASAEEGEHGTRRVDSWSSPLTVAIEGWQDYYRDLSVDIIAVMLDLSVFLCYRLYEQGRDVRFWGVKRGNTNG
jgi:hypothetical protein